MRSLQFPPVGPYSAWVKLNSYGADVELPGPLQELRGSRPALIKVLPQVRRPPAPQPKASGHPFFQRSFYQTPWNSESINSDVGEKGTHLFSPASPEMG